MKPFEPQKAKELADKMIQASADLARYLAEHFPAGARCGVLLNANQKTPTPATIFGIHPTIYGGEVRVEIDSAKPKSRYRIRSIAVRDVRDVDLSTAYRNDKSHG